MSDNEGGDNETVPNEEQHIESSEPSGERTVEAGGQTITLKIQETKTLEEEEEVTFTMRAKLFRFDKEAGEWKERGTGDVKLLKHKETGKIRVLMRREKTLKICANHNILPGMELKPNVGNDKSWVYQVPADFSDEEPKPETLAIRFANPENANKFKTAFEEARDGQKAEETQKTESS
eukprot:TRINITY_DN3332_c0_g1_i1.p1 TRINITY_DN3332_c0_g1~~TRINITY_DN3332_c0_g1_i1.p1  ORF type:complete len:178 (+),score=46.84 TRINITY_DN3332_c0_g1_i1:38-571(+)